MNGGRWIDRGVGILSWSLVLLAGVPGAGRPAEPAGAAVARGKELFTREWLPGDRRSHGGDGLGPLYNARSCAACHQLGGVGGAGPRHTNVTIVSVFLDNGSSPPRQNKQSEPRTPQQPDRSKLAELHPALRTQNSFPLHRSAADKGFTKWMTTLLGTERDLQEFDVQRAASAIANSEPRESFTCKVGDAEVELVPSQRNAPSLFGTALIDRIPERALEEVAASQARSPQVTVPDGESSANSEEDPDDALPVAGRVARLRNGHVGRFGWKAQTATLREFTLQACANELGLEVPGFHQAALPWKPGYKAPGLDLTAKECDDLIAFVASLPPPGRKPAETDQHAAETATGEKLFERSGCAACHRPKLGDVEGIYSDLLLHDMGQELSDTGNYGGSPVVAQATGDGPEPLPVLGDPEPARREKKLPKFGAAAREWRTPPLWGLRHSAPYLHDGRADTVAAAVAAHGGEGTASARQFFCLTWRERQQVELFLQSLAVPER